MGNEDWHIKQLVRTAPKFTEVVESSPDLRRLNNTKNVKLESKQDFSSGPLFKKVPTLYFQNSNHRKTIKRLDYKEQIMDIKIDLLKNHPETIPVLAKLWLKNLGERGDPDILLPEVKSWLHEWCNDRIPLAYIALVKDKPVGICSLQENDGIRPDLMPWVGDFCVDTAYQNQGIGKLILKAAQKKAKELGFKELYLFTPDLTIPAYYSGLGWEIIGMDQYKGHPVTVMKIQL